MAHIVELEWSEQRHAALAYLAEVLDEGYPTSPDTSDPWRIRAEKALVRWADGPWPMTAEEAAAFLEEQVKDRFPAMDLWQVDWREVRGVRGLRIQWGWGPSWLPVRAWADKLRSGAHGRPLRLCGGGRRAAAGRLHLLRQAKGCR
jgi:hypothetical protein